jgi:hypothetical protein
LSAVPRGFACRERERPEADRLPEGCLLEKLARRQANIFSSRFKTALAEREGRETRGRQSPFLGDFPVSSRRRLRIDYSRGSFATPQRVTFDFRWSARCSVHVSYPIERMRATSSAQASVCEKQATV